MSRVRAFEEKCERTGRRSLVRDAGRYGSEMGLDFVLAHPDPKPLIIEAGEKMQAEDVGKALRAKEEESGANKVRDQR